MVRGFLEEAPSTATTAAPEIAADTSPDRPSYVARPAALVALVAPHAGYVYSGPVAGSAYALVVPASPGFRRVVLLGPSHHVAFRGLALPECEVFATPLGEHMVDDAGVHAFEAHPTVRCWARAHAHEHSLEVQLPFVRVALGPLPVVPVITGDVDPGEVADTLEPIWTADTLVVVSSDLSHYLPYDDARRVDAETAAAVESLDVNAVTSEGACGAVALRGVMEAARRRSLEVRCVDLRNSGDTGPSRDRVRSRVVGYGAFGFWERA